MPTKSADNAEIGATVTVTVDRPLGSYHPEYKDMYYSIKSQRSCPHGTP